MQDEAPRLIRVAGEASVVYKKSNLYGRSSPSKGADARADAFRLKPDTLYLLASPLLWYGVLRLFEKMPASSLLLSLEHDPGLAKLSRRYQPREVAERGIVFFHPADPGEMLSHVEKIGVERFRRVELISLNGGYRVHSRIYSEIQVLLEEEIQQFWQNKYTLMHMLPLWVKNIFLNLAGSTGEKKQIRFFQQNPRMNGAICVAGAGPSLEAAVPFLQKNRSRLFLLAVDTACAPLHKNGIKPDMVVVQEAQFYNLYDFMSTNRIHAELCADITSYPGVLQLAKGGVNFFTGEFAKLALFARMGQYRLNPPPVPPLGSVGSTAVYVARTLTEGPVFIAGLDFSFFHGKTHARGAPTHQHTLQTTNRLLPVENMKFCTGKGIFQRESPDYERKILTTVTLDRYARNFSRFFTGQEGVYRLKPKGLSLEIPAVDHGRAEELLDQWNPGPIEEPAGGLRDFGGEDETVVFSKARVEDFLENEASLLREIYSRSRSYLEGNRQDPFQTKLLEQINSCEYLFLHFPDTGHRLRTLDPTMVKRVIVSAGHYIGVLERALSIAGAGEFQSEQGLS